VEIWNDVNVQLGAKPMASLMASIAAFEKAFSV
jgi:hypothetical protein